MTARKQKDRMRAALAVAAACLAACTARAAYIEEWDDPGLTNHNWLAWCTDGFSWTGGAYLVFSQFGGVGNSGYVRIDDMATLSEWDGVYWPAYTEEGPATNRMRAYTQDLDLNMDSLIRVYGRRDVASDLKSGEVCFFIGRWEAATNQAFYYYNQPVTVNTNDWDVRTVIDIAPGDWMAITNVGSMTPESLYDNPQQYGFVIIGATGQPSGALRFDEFSNVATNLLLTNVVVTDTRLYAATNTITATNSVRVESTSDVRFLGGREVKLAPGFWAQTGSTFNARIEPGL